MDYVEIFRCLGFPMYRAWIWDHRFDRSRGWGHTKFLVSPRKAVWPRARTRGLTEDASRRGGASRHSLLAESQLQVLLQGLAGFERDSLGGGPIVDSVLLDAIDQVWLGIEILENV